LRNGTDEAMIRKKTATSLEKDVEKIFRGVGKDKGI